MPICRTCLDQACELLNTQALADLEAADRAESEPRTRVHGTVLRAKASGLGYAVGWLRRAAREQVGG